MVHGRWNKAAYWIDREAVCERVHLGSGSTILVKTQTGRIFLIPTRIRLRQKAQRHGGDWRHWAFQRVAPAVR